MPAASNFYRPQTSRQAKRAYQKSNKTARLSASELAAIERRAVLKERADRIKEREARRKANIKKREEKIAKEKELAAREGRPFDDAKGRLVGPSQQDLGQFLGVLKKVNSGNECKDLEDEYMGKLIGDNGRNQACTIKANTNLQIGMISRGGQAKTQVNGTTPRLQTRKEQEQIDIDAVDDIFVSNTQIERELSPGLSSASFSPRLHDLQPTFETPHLSTRTVLQDERPRNISRAVSAATEILAHFSTQDFDYEPTQRPIVHHLIDPDPRDLAIPSTRDLIDQLSPLFTQQSRADDPQPQTAKAIEMKSDQSETCSSHSSFSDDGDLSDFDLFALAVKMEREAVKTDLSPRGKG